MDPLSIAASIAGLLTLSGAIISHGYAHISKAKGNRTEFNQLLSEVSSLAGLLHVLQQQHATHGGTDVPLIRVPGETAETWKVTLERCQTTLNEIKSLIDSLASANAVRLMIRGVSLSNKVASLLNQAERYKTLFALCLQLQNNADSNTSIQLNNEVLVLLQQLRVSQESFWEHAKLKELAESRTKIRDWLGTTTEALHDEIVGARVVGSCQWLVDRHEFNHWLTADGFSGFWLTGNQGSGKSFITSNVIGAIEGILADNELILYHYCRFSHSGASSSQQVIAAIMAQLWEQLPQTSPIPEPLRKAADRFRCPSKVKMTKLSEVFFDLCQDFSRIFIVIDGLDELGDRGGILKLLDALPASTPTFKVFVTSRPEDDLEHTFHPYLTVALKPSDVLSDMKAYALRELEVLGIEDEQSDEPNIAQQLVERSQGMFLWLACQIDHLSRIRTAITTEVITALPQGLERTFEDVLLRLEEEDLALSLEILRVITFSAWPLSLAEVVEAVAVSTHTKNITQLRRNSLRRHSDVFHLCGSLVRRSELTGGITLAHYSVKEFLLCPCLAKGRRNFFHLEEQSSHKLMVDKCTRYLSMTDPTSEAFRRHFSQPLESLYIGSETDYPGQLAFLKYASSHLSTHLSQLDPDSFQEIWPSLNDFLRHPGGCFETWRTGLEYIHGAYRFPQGAGPIHMAASLGLKLLLTALLEADSALITLRTSDGRTPLHIALENHQDGIVELLMPNPPKDRVDAAEFQSPMSLKDERGRTALHTAIETGNEAVVVQLVTAGADVNATQDDGRTPIFVAVENRWELLAAFLSELADPHQFLPDGRSLLHVAAETGSFVWVAELLQCHKEPLLNSQDKNGWTALHYAVDRQRLRVVSVLVEAGCSIVAWDRKYWTPLHSAIHRQNLESAKLLLIADWTDRAVLPPPQPSLPSRQLDPESSDQTVEGPGAQSNDDDLDERLALLTLGNGQHDSVSTYPGIEGRRDDTADIDSNILKLPFEPSPSRTGKYPDAPFGPNHRKYHRRLKYTSSPRRVDEELLGPIGIAAISSYTEGMELLLQFVEKLEESDLICDGDFEIALSSKNAQIITMLFKMYDAFDEVLAHLLLEIPVDSVLDETLRSVISTKEVYDKYFQDALVGPLVGRKTDLVQRIIQVWPDPSDEMKHRALRSRPELLKTFLENNLGLPIALLENAPGYPEPFLHHLIQKQEFDCIRQLVKCPGISIEIRNARGETPLLALAENPSGPSKSAGTSARLSLADLLLSSLGADAHARDENSRGLCHKCARTGDDQFLERVLKVPDMDITSRDKNNRSPLLLAVESGSVRSIELLLKHLQQTESPRLGCERIIDAMEYANMRSAPLLRSMVARPERNVAIVTALITAEETAFDQLKPSRQDDLLALRTAFYIEALTWSIECDFKDGFSFLLPKIPRAALTSRTSMDGDTIYHVSAAVPSTDYLKTILQASEGHRDASIKTLMMKNTEKQTPMDIVIKNKFEYKFSMLLHYGVRLADDQREEAEKNGFWMTLVDSLDLKASSRPTASNRSNGDR
ncbi:ankyrin [Sporormia fimetaria CBS 119925]|uniref:Ankyrin n=1 Tax=Sporormia fimetaria CBS 119925 TaxID=1340428 RepID=A0A6A6VHA7_9PLEO|nr:ankyrin [Sporormia fimetaria CBS 119925]